MLTPIHTQSLKYCNGVSCFPARSPPPQPPLTLRFNSEKCNGFTCFVNVVGLKLCTVFCPCFALSLQSSEVSWVFYVSFSHFLLHILLPSSSLHVCVWHMHEKKLLDADLFFLFFTSVFHLPFSSLPFSFEWNEKKSINIMPSMSAVWGCLESVWETKAPCTEHAQAFAGPTNKLSSSTMWYITSVIFKIVAATLTSTSSLTVL